MQDEGLYARSIGMKKATIDRILSRYANMDAAELSFHAERVSKRFWRTLRKAARYIPFMEDVVAAYFCAMDPQTPLRAKAILIAALAYFVLPVDLIPDFIAGIGFTDDVAVLTAAITAMRAHITPAHRAAAREALAKD